MMSQAALRPHWEAGMEQVQTTGDDGADAAILVAVELSKASWLLAIYDPTTGKVSRRGVDGGDAAALIGLVERHRRDAEVRAGRTVGTECVFEAGYDGFWLQRRLELAGIACRVMDPASLKVDRRARRVKTDRVDSESLLRALQAWRRGDRQACSFVRVPSVEEEDARRPHRELARLTKEQVGHVNRIEGLLALHGVRDYRPLRRDRRKALGPCGLAAARYCRRAAARKSSGSCRGSSWFSATSRRSRRRWRTRHHQKCRRQSAPKGGPSHRVTT
jgi:transposase